MKLQARSGLHEEYQATYPIQPTSIYRISLRAFITGYLSYRHAISTAISMGRQATWSQSDGRNLIESETGMSTSSQMLWTCSWDQTSDNRLCSLWSTPVRLESRTCTERSESGKICLWSEHSRNMYEEHYRQTKQHCKLNQTFEGNPLDRKVTLPSCSIWEGVRIKMCDIFSQDLSPYHHAPPAGMKHGKALVSTLVCINLWFHMIYRCQNHAPS